MARTVILTQTRPNTGIAFHDASDDFKALKQEMVDAGTLVDNGGSNNETDLIRTWTLTFTDEDVYVTYLNDARAQSYFQVRQSYNLANGISEYCLNT